MDSQLSRLYNFLQSQSVLSLATADKHGPWSAPVLYAADLKDDRPTLYFLSSAASRHSQSLPHNGLAAGSIYAAYQDDWQLIKGVQMQGLIAPLADLERAQFEVLYFSRFPEIRKIIDNPSSQQETKIAGAFKNSTYYCFSPTYIRVTDNSDAFANRQEWHF